MGPSNLAKFIGFTLFALALITDATASSPGRARTLPHGPLPHTALSLFTNAPGSCEVTSLDQIIAFSSETARRRPVACQDSSEGFSASATDARLPFLMTENCGRRVTQSCARTAVEGQTLLVDRIQSWPCRDNTEAQASGVPPIGYSTHARYRLTRIDHQFKVSLRIRLDVQSSTPERGSEILTHTRSCVPTLQSFWSRYGIIYDISFDSTRQPDLGLPDHMVVADDSNSDDSERRSNSGRYFYNGARFGPNHMCRMCGVTIDCPPRSCDEVQQNEYCLLLLHETAHLLGLPDEYRETESDGTNHCPLRDTVHADVEPYSVMANQDRGWDHIEFFPRHIQAILSPACSRQTNR